MFEEPTHVRYALVTRPRHDEKVILTPCDTLLEAVRKQDQHDFITSVVMCDSDKGKAVDISLHFIGNPKSSYTGSEEMLLASFERHDNDWTDRHVTGAMIDTFDDNAFNFIKSLLSFFDSHRNRLGSTIV